MVEQCLPLVGTAQSNCVRYTIATLLSNPGQYEAMRASFEAGGFVAADTEFLVVDNSRTNTSCAYRGLNRLLANARGEYVILCHQDVRLLAEGRQVLDARLDELTRHDPDWAVAGNAGGEAPGRLALRITDPHGASQHVGSLPARVNSLDENFMVVRRSARVGFSNNLSGFHFYGADICLAADVMGYSCYVMDFHLQHLSPGKKDASFAVAERQFIAKWSKALRGRWMQTTCSLVYVSGGPASSKVANFFGKWVAGLARRLHRPAYGISNIAPAPLAAGDESR